MIGYLIWSGVLTAIATLRRSLPEKMGMLAVAND